jgi:hypothetical protein
MEPVAMPLSLLLLILSLLLASGPARADCELLYAPPELRARLLAFHHANELRRAREQPRGAVADGGATPAAPSGRNEPARDHAAPARRPIPPR